jgi:NADPH:quinone reductase
MMKAIVLHEYGGPEVLRFEDVATPEPKPGEILIKVRNVSVNVTLDIMLRSGVYPMKPTLPHVMGTDPVGEVVALGAGLAKDFALGDRVAVHTPMPSPDCVPGAEADDPGIDRLFGIHCWGGYAEYAVIPEGNAFAIPENLSFPEATVIMRHLPTARHLLFAKAGLCAGEWVLVMGATGGLASCCVQVAKRMGATVIAAAGADDRVRMAMENFGADHGINYRQQDLAAEVMKLTGGRGVNVVTESIGDAELWPGAMASLGKHGRLVTAGAHGGGQVTLDLRMMYIKRQRIIGSPGCDFADIEWALDAARDGSIRAPIVDRVMPLHQAAEAHRLVEGRVPVGKLLLDPIQSAGQPAGG